MKIGFLGAGSMGGAIISGAINMDVIAPSDIYIYDNKKEALDKFASLGCNICKDAQELGNSSDIIIIAVKPNQAKDAIEQLKDSVNGKALISVVAGRTIDMLKGYIPLQLCQDDVRILRVMPNTPTLVGMGAFALCEETDITDEEKGFVEKLFGSLGEFEWMSEKLMNAASGFSGAAPAYTYMFIEALADGGVYEGFPRDTALKLAAQTVMGAAKMVLETGEHPGALKDKVCSPGGITIAGVKALEDGGFRGTVIDAVCKAADKAKEMER